MVVESDVGADGAVLSATAFAPKNVLFDVQLPNILMVY
jgi:hypothetical protein